MNNKKANEKPSVGTIHQGRSSSSIAPQKSQDEVNKKDLKDNLPGSDPSFSKFRDDEYQYMQNQVVTYVDFDVPWNLSTTYKFLYTKPGLEDTKKITQTLSLTGDISLTKKWKIRDLN